MVFLFYVYNERQWHNRVSRVPTDDGEGDGGHPQRTGNTGGIQRLNQIYFDSSIL